MRTFGYKRALFRFNLEELPAGAVIHSATFRGESAGSEGPGINVQLIGMARDWDEHSVTWTQAASGVPWAAAGADSPGEDRLDHTTDTAMVYGGENIFWTWDVTALAQDWLDGSLPNYGFMLVSWDSNVHREVSFVAKNHGYPSKLIIEYSY
jgi:hypothetical protein